MRPARRIRLTCSNEERLACFRYMLRVRGFLVVEDEADLDLDLDQLPYPEWSNEAIYELAKLRTARKRGPKNCVSKACGVTTAGERNLS